MGCLYHSLEFRFKAWIKQIKSLIGFKSYIEKFKLNQAKLLPKNVIKIDYF